MYVKLKGAKVFSTIDLRSGYHHIALGKSSRAKIAFVTPFGKYEFLMVPFGLAQAPAYFQLLMNKILRGLKFTMTYLDDIIIFSQDESQHLEHLEIVFSHLRAAGLKMKRSKCDFFKSEIHYLGHLISPEGISPLPNKLDSIKHMPAPNSAKEIKQFLGLTGYYRKFVPRFADISRPLTTLTKKDTKFEWTSACQKSFELLKEALCGEPVLKYADTSKSYTLYTDASKYGWAGVLTQPHVMAADGKSTTTDHPVAFVSGFFRGSQLNWAALMKEAFAIYMSVKKLSFYLTDAQILLRSDHKPLEKFLLKNTLNLKVNNWAMELEAFNIQFDYIQGSNNILADTLSRLISIDPDTPTMPKEPGYEFGYAIFEEFPKVTTHTYEVNEVVVGTNTEIFKSDPELQKPLQSIENPIAPQKLQVLQQQDTNIEILKCKLRNNRLDKEYYSLDENELLTRKVIDGGHEFCAIYLPSVLIFQVLRTAHDDLGHNGFPRTYAAIKRVFFWKGMKEDIRKHCKTCAMCQLHKLENVKFERKIFKPSLQAMDFICMDLIGEFHPPTSRGHCYALTAVCMLTGFTWCVPLKTKTAEEVAKAYMDHIYCSFGGSIKILTDNVTEFKNKLFKEVVDHKPLEKFLLKNTLNLKVNNWAMELEAFNIQFDYIQGSNNILADTLSRLISIDPDTPTMPKEPGYEFGYAIFEEFLKVTTHTYEVNEVVVGTNTEIFKSDPELQKPLQSVKNPIAPQKLQVLQQQDTNIEILKCKLRNNRLDKEYYSLDENELLTRKVIDGGHEFCAIYLPSVLIFQVLRTAHDDLGHNGFPRTYAAIKRVFFWKGMKEDIRKHCKTCALCQLHKLENVKFERKIFKPSLQAMDFICMDLIGEFHPPTSRGNCYALTAVCMFTGFTWCVPLKTKTAEEVAKAYMDHIYCSFGGSIKILTDNGTEFKNKLFKVVVSKLGTEFSIHSPPYRPQSNDKIEGFHRFLKTCIGKHINCGLEWDELTPMATACYNFFPNCSTRESAFSIMLGRDPINKLNMLLHAA